MDTYNILANNMLLLAHNPSAMLTLQLAQLQKVQDVEGQITLRDPTDPVVYLAEAGVVMGHSIIQSVRETVPKMYPSMAQTYDDLFRHMSDVDYVDVFAQPSVTVLPLYIDVDSLLAKAIPLVYDGVRKVTIPRDTVFMVSGYPFAIQYPIEIRVLPYGTNEKPAFQVVWITDNVSPIAPVSTNALDWSLTSTSTMVSLLLKIDIPVMQYAVSEGAIDTVAGDNQFIIERAFTNKFYYARVWMQRDNSTVWTEIKHTHSRDVYDVNEATALIQVVDQRIRCTIPSVYMKTGLVGGTVRLDIYTTVGPLSIDVSSYPSDTLTLALRDLNGEVDESYINPIKNFSIKELAPAAGTMTTGGRTALTFEELRSRVVNNAVGARQLPVTFNQMSAAANDYGLDLSTPIDYVTGRTFHMSKTMPDSSLASVSSPIGAITAPLFFSWNELIGLSTVRQNGNRLTIMPDTLYRFADTSLQVDVTMTELLKTMRKEDLINAGNTASYLFTPFHYVVDINNNAVDVRIYQLDSPLVTGKRFVTTNVSTELSVVSDSYELVATSTGFALRIVTKSEQSYQNLDDSQCFAQISYTPRGYTNEVAYINGTLIGKRDTERVWEFPLETNLDVDRNDELVLTNTRLASSSATPVPVALLQDFNIFYGVTGWAPKNYERYDMDSVIVVPARDAVGVTHEIFSIELGKALTAFWRKARAVTDTINYKYYQEDVLAFYDTDKIKYNSNGVPEYTIVEGAVPPVQIVYEHRAGEPVLDDDGNQKIAHYKGELMRDELNQPIIANSRSIKFRSEMAVFDARYKFANTADVSNYLKTVIEQIVSVVTISIPKLQVDLLELTEAYFVPITTMGYINARTEDGAITPIPAENQFTVAYYLTAANRQNTALLKIIQSTTSSVINTFLNENKTISTTNLGKALQDALQDSVIAVEVGLMGPDKDMRIFTVVSDAAQATIGKKLELTPEGKVGLKDDIVTSFNRHDVSAN